MISDAAKQCIALIGAIATGRGTTPVAALEDLEAINTALQLPLDCLRCDMGRGS